MSQAALFHAVHIGAIDALSIERRAPFLSLPAIRFQTPEDNAAHFVGRLALLEDLEAHMQKGRLVSLTTCRGLGGVGKTQLATRYFHQAAFQHKFWFHAESLDALALQYRELAVELGLVSHAALHPLPREEVLSQVKTYLGRLPSALLVYDNAIDFEALRQFLPERGALLLTTRRSDFPGSLEVDVMTEEEASELVLKILTIAPAKEEISTLAERLGRLPLALVQAAAYIKECDITISEYLRRFQTLMDSSILPPDCTHPNVWITFTLSAEHIARLHPPAMQLLRYMACVSPDPIPRALFQPLFEDFNQAATLLRLYSLIQFHFAEETLLIHRLLQEVVLAQKPASEHQKDLVALLPVFNHQIEAENETMREFQRRMKLFPHATHFLSKCETASAFVGSRGFSIFLYQLGKLAFDQVNMQVSLTLLEKAHLSLTSIASREDPAPPELKPTILRLLGRAHGTLGHHDKQKAYHLEALELFTTLYGERHLRVVETLSTLSAAYWGEGDYAEQLKVLERALCLAESLEPPLPVEVAKVKKRIADAHAAAGNPATQREILEEILPFYEKEYGPDHIETAEVLNSLGYAYGSLNEPAKKLACVEKAFAIYEKIYGSTSMALANVLINLADTYGDLKDYERMHHLCQRALFIIQTTVGIDHTHYPDALIYLAKAEGGLAHPEEKERLLLNVLEIVQNQRGPERTFLLALHHLEEVHPDPSYREVNRQRWLTFLNFFTKEEKIHDPKHQGPPCVLLTCH